MDILVSVIIPVYRDERLNLCLKALLNQNFPKRNFEIIVVNNDPDATIDLRHHCYDKLNLKILDEPTPGSYAARNKGIIHASGKILAFTDSDCIPDVDWLKNAMVVFEADLKCEIGILAGNVILFYNDDYKLTSAEIYEKYTGFTQEQYAKEGNSVTANWFSYKSVVEGIGGFDSGLKSNGDTELSARISKKYKVVFAPEVVVKHPARYRISDLVYKYRRLLGGTHARRFNKRPILFFWHIIEFSWRRLRFAIKKSVTISLYESIAIWKTSISIIIGAWREYFNLIAKGESKR